MSSAWEQATRLFGAARELEPSEREAFLQAACGANRELRDAVEGLLRDDIRTTDGFLDASAATGIRDLLSDALREGLEPGDVLKDRYRIDEHLGAGGQAIVYRATDLSLSRAVVVKVLRAAGGEQLQLRRFETEMEALARINHPGVVGILDVGTLPDGSRFLVVQHISGVSLRTLMQGGPIEPRRVARLLRELGSALAAAHAAGVAHQDLKPENVMIQRPGKPDETVKLIDFGIAKVDRAGIAPLVTTIMVAGTVRYMAPEQFEGANSPAGDIYALGLITCEMLTGTLDAGRLPKTMRAAAKAVGAATARDPARRPADVKAWADEVAGAIESPPVRHRVTIAASVAAALVATGLVLGAQSVLGDPPRLVEKSGALDPLSEGFQRHNDIAGTVAMNSTRDQYKGWRVFSSDQGHYYHRLSRAQKRRAMQRGWRLAASLRADQGMTFTSVDLMGYGKRFEVDVAPDANERLLVRLTTQLVPTFQGVETHIPNDRAYHRYELRYDAGQQSADLWIDGTKHLTKYTGVSDFQDDQDDWGVAFGAAVFKSERGEGAFESVRFEISP